MDAQTPWWSAPLIDGGKVALGAVIGFFATQVKDWRDRKRTETAFLTAVHQELLTIQKQLVKSDTAMEESLDRLKRGFRVRVVMKISTKVFDSQLSNLKNLTNPLILKIVDFYSTLGVLDDMAAGINTLSDEFSANKNDKTVQSEAASTLLVMQEEIHRYRKMIFTLLESFPAKFKNDQLRIADKSRS
jgi:hypothetical protein